MNSQLPLAKKRLELSEEFVRNIWNIQHGHLDHDITMIDI